MISLRYLMKHNLSPWKRWNIFWIISENVATGFRYN
jgi:hypothetical protein